MPRFTDAKLQQFYEEFEDHRIAFEAHRMEQQELHTELLASIKENTTAVASLASKTETIIEVWEASQGAVKIFRWIGTGVKWMAGLSIAVAAAWYSFKGGK